MSLALVALLSGCSDGEITTSDPPATNAERVATTPAPAPTTTTTTAATTTTAPSTTTTLPAKAFPQGTLVAFSSDRAGTGALFVIDTTDGEIRQVGFGLETMNSPAWSPDGRSLVYVSLSGRSRLVVLDVASAWDGPTDPVELTDGALAVDSPTWSPGGVIAFEVSADQGSDVWTIDPGGGEPELLLGNAAGPAYSPDGTRLAFVAVGDRESAIAVLEVASGEIVVLTDPADRGINPAWSSDGTEIVYTAGTRDFDVWVADLASGETRRLTSEPNREWWPCFTADGAVVYARFDPDALHDLWILDPLEEAAAPLVAAPSDDWFPACQPPG
ncbi:MAG: hypothetical protein QNJ81_08250 [Acidimicrobiia bacterium]|nr:hypothetical protein [Acidimicrobiia bacterium]